MSDDDVERLGSRHRHAEPPRTRQEAESRGARGGGSLLARIVSRGARHRRGDEDDAFLLALVIVNGPDANGAQTSRAEHRSHAEHLRTVRRHHADVRRREKIPSRAEAIVLRPRAGRVCDASASHPTLDEVHQRLRLHGVEVRGRVAVPLANLRASNAAEEHPRGSTFTRISGISGAARARPLACFETRPSPDPSSTSDAGNATDDSDAAATRLSS